MTGLVILAGIAAVLLVVLIVANKKMIKEVERREKQSKELSVQIAALRVGIRMAEIYETEHYFPKE